MLFSSLNRFLNNVAMIFKGFRKSFYQNTYVIETVFMAVVNLGKKI